MENPIIFPLNYLSTRLITKINLHNLPAGRQAASEKGVYTLFKPLFAIVGILINKTCNLKKTKMNKTIY